MASESAAARTGNEFSARKFDCCPMAGACILHDGPIDLIVEAFGAPREIEAAYRCGLRALRNGSRRTVQRTSIPAAAVLRRKGMAARRRWRDE